MSKLLFQTLEIQNFRSFLGQHVFELWREPGLYFIKGQNEIYPELESNGVGKSSLIDALLWVLWGKTGRDNRPANAVIPWGLAKGTTSVALTFKRMGVQHLLKRTRRPNALTLTNIKSGQTREIEQNEVAVLLGMSEEMLRRTVMMSQFGELFLDLKAEQQSAMFNEALALDIWLKASSAASEKKRTASSKLDSITQEISRFQGRKTELDSRIEQEALAEKSFEKKLNAQIDGLSVQIKQKTDELQTLLAKAAPKGPKSAKSIAVASKAIETEIMVVEASWRALNEKTAKITSDLDSMRRQRGILTAKADSYVKAISGTRACPECGQKASIKHLEEKLDAANTELKAIKKNLASLDEQLAGLDDATDLNDRLKALRTAARQSVQLTSEIAALEREKAKLEQSENHYEASIKEAKKRLSGITSDLKDAEDSLTKQEELKSIADFWVGAFKEIRLNQIDQVLTELEMAVNRHAEMLGLTDWRIKFQTEKVKQDGGVSTTFTVMLYPPDQDEPVKFESYSGGESQRWQLAVAFGLSEIILNRAGVFPNILFLDEPTRGLSSGGIENLLEHLRERALELKQAVYICEHHSLERGLFDGTILIRKDQSGSHIVEM